MDGDILDDAFWDMELFPSGLDVDGRDEPGHDEWNSRVQRI
jgi:hypothetical protein